MPRVLLHFFSLFQGGNREESEDDILWLLEVVTQRNVDYLYKHPQTPKLYDSGVVYALPDQMTSQMSERTLKEVRAYLLARGASEDSADHAVAVLEGIEVFRDVPAVLKLGRVDCDNLASFRSAELRLAGIKAAPYITWRETSGGTIYHALVRWPDGTSEDPSLLLGLGGAERESERAEERRKNVERYQKYVAAGQALFHEGKISLPDADKQLASLGLLPRTQIGWNVWNTSNDRPETRIDLYRSGT